MIDSIRHATSPGIDTQSSATVRSSFLAAGRDFAMSLAESPLSRHVLHGIRRTRNTARKAIDRALRSAPRDDENDRWLRENGRVLRTAVKQTADLEKSLRDYPAALPPGGKPAPRAFVVAAGFLNAVQNQYRDEDLVSFLQGFQEIRELNLAEIWGLEPALQLELLSRIGAEAAAPGSTALPALITSLFKMNDSEWKDLFEQVSLVDAELRKDPVGAYASMDYESRDMYRERVGQLAKSSPKSEREVAAAAVALAARAKHYGGVNSRAALRRAHTGFYLIDLGQQSLRSAIGFRPGFVTRVRDWLYRYGEAFYVLGIELTTLLIVYLLLEGLGSFTPAFVGFFLLLIPATQAAVDLINNLISSIIKPRVLPKLDFSKGLCTDCTTMVAVPSLLLNETQVRGLATDLEIRYLANDDPHLYYALLTDSPDSDHPIDERDQLVEVCQTLIDDLNRRYGTDGRTPFYLLHRHRVFNESEGRWMGWERKRGKLLDLNQLLRGGYDSFPVKAGNTAIFPKVRFIITLDSDTQLPRDVAHRLIGTLAHPLNQAVVDPSTKMVVEGYGILQPRIGVSIQSASRSWLANIYSGQTGFDIYTRAISDVYQDLFGEAIFTGKGIYEVDAFRESLEHRFPENALLSHDLIEGAYARAGLVSDIELIDDYPSHFSAYSRRKHRWMRGDWQILRWVLDRVPDRKRRLVPNPVNLISRWKILDNLRRSLFDPAALVLLLSGWFYLPGDPLFWTAASIAMLLMPAYSGLFFSFLRAPWGRASFPGWAKDTAWNFVREHVIVLLHLVFLMLEALIACDAIGRSLARVFVTKRKLLEWETAAEAETALKGKRAAADTYLAWGPWIAIAIGGLLWLLRPGALRVAAPILALWILSRAISKWLNSAPRESVTTLEDADVDLLRSSAVRMWRYYAEWCVEETSFTIPDHVREDDVVAARLSPTNLGFLLNAQVAALHLGYLTLPEFLDVAGKTLAALMRMPKYRGHILNWYDTGTLETLPPRFVSTVDSGNLVACLWALKQAAIALGREQPGDEVLWAGICDLAREVGATGEAGAIEFRDLVLRSEAKWKDQLPELRDAAREYAQTASGEPAEWAKKIEHRIAEAQSWLESGGLTAEMRDDLDRMVEIIDGLIREMDFSFLYNQRKRVLSVGYDVTADRLEPSTYDLLASEARIATFVAIAKGDVPQESWFHLGRKHAIYAGESVLVSWTGTMFEYLMPAIWMRHYPDTLIQRSMEAAVRVQRKRVRGRMPWGVSESASAPTDGGTDHGYAAFGIPEIAMKLMDSRIRVVTPYATFLALLVEPRAAMKNLRRMAALGWAGKYGYYESADYTSGEPKLVRLWMAHHLGMSLLPVANLLLNNMFQQYFHAEPRVMATELLLDERMPSSIEAEAETAAQSA